MSNSKFQSVSFIIQFFAGALKMHLLLRMILLLSGILDPGICAKSIELKSLITATYMDEQQEQRWYRVVHDVQTLSETTFPMLRLDGDQDAFYTIHMSLLYGQMFGNEVSFYNYNWQTADWDMSYSLIFGIDVCLSPWRELMKCSRMGSHLILFLFYILPQHFFFISNFPLKSAFFSPSIFYPPWRERMKCSRMGSHLILFLFYILPQHIFLISNSP